MGILKILILLCVSQYSVVLSIPRRTTKYNNRNDPPKICPEDQSLLSTKDITDMIDYVAEKLQLEENIVKSYYAKAMDIKNKHLEELNEFQDYLEDRPKHIKHILKDMANNRQKLEPLVELVAAQLEDIDSQNDKFLEVAGRASKLLRQLGLYRAVCEIHCEDTQFDNGFQDDEITMPSKYLSDTGACWRLKDLHDEIADELNEFREHFSEEILTFIENKDIMYENKVQSYKNRLIMAALNQFGFNMYDILSLQDSYHHFSEDLNNLDVASQIAEIKKNTLNIEQLLMVLERDVDKYREYCMNCHPNIRMRRDVSPTYSSSDLERRSIDDHIDITIKNIKDLVRSNITAIFAELEAHLNNIDNIDSLMNKLLPIDDVDEQIGQEQEAFDALKRAIPQSSIDKLMDLLQKSKALVQDLEDVKKHLENIITDLP